ncbi:MAG TPA: hypothetical protein VJ623_01260, partial [Holophagaceae bacterium]|nr:hypothetical protein [Holophagaceae bacterium]
MRRLLRAAAPFLAGLALTGGSVAGRVTDGRQGLAGARVYPDRLPRVSPDLDPPVALTDAQGRFHLELDPSDTVLAVEK